MLAGPTTWIRAAGVTLLLLTVACGDDDGGSAAPDDVSIASDLEEGEVVVDVLDAGAEPRQALRFDPEVGTEQAITIRTDSFQSIEARGQSQEVDAPAVEFDVVYIVTSVDGDEILAAVEYEDGRVDDSGDVDAATVATMEDVVAAFVGQTGEVRYDTRGNVIELTPPDLDLPALGAFADEIIESVSGQAPSLAVPFPEEPVGEGARWRVTSVAEITGLDMQTVTDIELTRLDDDDIEARMSQTITFVPGPTELLGVDADVEGGELRGDGQVTWNLSGIVALVEQVLEGDAIIVVEQGGDSARVEQSIQQEVHITER